MATVTRICLIGPESTGKSTVAERLARELGVPCVPEYAREYALMHANELTYDDVEPIGRGQLANELRLMPDDGLLILDTDLVSTAVYSRHFYGRVPQFVERTARERLADLYLLFDVDVPFVADGARATAADRDATMAEFRTALRALGADVIEISGDWQARYERARAAVRQAAR